jgi:hypothetical protein
VLARLDQDLDPLRAAVDREGNLLRISGEPQQDERGLADRVVDIVTAIGYYAEPLDGETPDVTRWFAREDIPELSRAEAEILSERWAEDLAREGVISHAAKIRDPLRDALLESFRDAASSGNVGRIAVDTLTMRKALEPSEFEKVKRWIESKVGSFPEHSS